MWWSTEWIRNVVYFYVALACIALIVMGVYTYVMQGSF